MKAYCEICQKTIYISPITQHKHHICIKKMENTKSETPLNVANVKKHYIKYSIESVMKKLDDYLFPLMKYCRLCELSSEDEEKLEFVNRSLVVNYVKTLLLNIRNLTESLFTHGDIKEDEIQYFLYRYMEVEQAFQYCTDGDEEDMMKIGYYLNNLIDATMDLSVWENYDGDEETNSSSSSDNDNDIDEEEFKEIDKELNTISEKDIPDNVSFIEIVNECKKRKM